MKLGWLSDVHLDWLSESGLCRFLDELGAYRVDGWLVGGDIGEAASIVPFLRRIEEAIQVPIYFVLGNHDFYGDSIAGVRAQVGSSIRDSERLVWLTVSDPKILKGGVALVGDDSWGDARFGDPQGTPIELNDFYLIEELSGQPRATLIPALNQLGDESANRLAPKLSRAAQPQRNVVILTHVPPFKEAAWHQGKQSTDEYLPWFSCRAVGRAILECAEAHPDTTFLVLCGHTHGSGTCSPVRNVTVLTAEATYGAPQIQRILEFSASGSS